MPPPTEVHIARLPISLPCPVPVLPGTPDTMRDGEPIPLEERTEACAVDAFWMIGAQVCCDIHFRIALDLLKLDYDDVQEEAAGNYDIPAEPLLEHWRKEEAKPWAERFRYPQSSVTQSPEVVK
jgi:hypothetical protein